MTDRLHDDLQSLAPDVDTGAAAASFKNRRAAKARRDRTMTGMAGVFVLLLAGFGAFALSNGGDDGDGQDVLVADGSGGLTAAPRETRTFEVDGAEVLVETNTLELPASAERVEFSGTVIDNGFGPNLCLGGTADSLPPQCSGPVAVGLSMDGWAQEQGGVQWGERTVIVSWPPVDNEVQVFRDRRPVLKEVSAGNRPLPEECAEADLTATPEAINAYGNALDPDVYGSVYLANNSQVVLMVTEDPDPHREALGNTACVIQVERSENAQRALQNEVSSLLDEGNQNYITFTSGNGPGGRVEVGLAVADAATVRLIAGAVSDPTGLRFMGSMALLSECSGCADGGEWLNVDVDVDPDVIIGDGPDLGLDTPPVTDRADDGPCPALEIQEVKQGLPDAVAAKRAAILDAVYSCDLDRLLAETAPDFKASFGGGTVEENWQDVDPEFFFTLAAILNMPVGTIQPIGEAPVYIWPSAFTFDDWDSVPEIDREALRPLYGDGDFDGFAEFGGYVGLRMGITIEGDWTFFLAGD